MSGPETKAIVEVNKRHLPTIDVKRTAGGKTQTEESFGISAVINSRPGMMSKIIRQGSEVPVSHRKRYFPVEDYQRKYKITCYKGEEALAEKNRKLGEFTISGIAPVPKDEAKGVDIIFSIDRLGVVLVDAIDLANPDNHLKIRLDYVDSRENLVTGVAKGVARELLGMFLPMGKKK